MPLPSKSFEIGVADIELNLPQGGPAVATLYVSDDSTRSGACGGDRLYIEERTLYPHSDRPRLVLDLDELRSLERAAGELAEKPLQATKLARDTASAEDAEDELRLVFASAKLESYGAFRFFFIARALLERVLTGGRYQRVEWLTTRPSLAAAVAEDLDASATVRFSIRSHADRVRREPPIARLKKRHLDWSVRAASTLFDAPPRAIRMSARSRYLVCFDVRNPGMIDNLLSVAARVRDRDDEVSLTGVYFERRVGQAVRRSQIFRDLRPLHSLETVGSFLRVLPKYVRLRRKLATTEFYCSGDGPRGVRAVAATLRRRLSGAYLYQALVDLRELRKLLHGTTPSVVLLASDSHRTSRLLTILAKRRGIRTLVLQHGALVGEFAYVPVVADRIGVWGEWCKAWFVERGVEDDRIEVVGYPRGNMHRTPLVAAPNDMVLYAAQPLAEHVTRELFTRVLDALESLPGHRLLVRPHPGEGERELLRSVLDERSESLRRRVAFSAVGRALHEDMAQCGVVVAAQSTVGIDAIGCELPLVLLVSPHVSQAIPFLEFGAALAAYDAAELAGMIATAYDEEIRLRLVEGGRKFKDAYVAADAEQAAENVAVLLRSLESEPSEGSLPVADV